MFQSHTKWLNRESRGCSLVREHYLVLRGDVDVDFALRCQRTRVSKCAREHLKEGPVCGRQGQWQAESSAVGTRGP